MKPLRWPLVASGILFGTVTTALAQSTWVEIKSPHFTVVSNAGEGRARDAGWQFEQVRAAILTGWPWARPRLDRPVLVIAARDESTMNSLLAQSRGSRDSATLSMGDTAPDRHYIAIRSDVRSDERVEANPYYNAYWVYSAIVLGTGSDRPLPPWFWTGVSCVLANSMVRPTEIRFGLPIPWLVRSARNESRLRLTEFLTLDSNASYYKDPQTRDRFEAQAWAFMHYLMYEASGVQPDRFNTLTRLVLEGRPSVEAVQEVFGNLDALEQAYLNHVRKPVMQYSLAKVETSIDAKAFTMRTLSPADSAAIRAGLHVATDRSVEARALIADSRKMDVASPLSHEVEGILLDREGKRAEAQAAFEKAELLKSENFYTYFRLAALTWPDKASSPDLERRLRRASALNDAHAPTLAMLAEALVAARRPAEALAPARRAVELEPGSVQSRLSLARVQWALMNRSDAIGVARSARLLSRTDDQRKEAQDLIDFFNRAQ